MHVRPYEKPLLEFEEYVWQKKLLLYVPPGLLILGIVGNLLSFIILMRRSMRGYSTYLYLAVLSITDTLVLIVGLLRLWVGELTGYDPRDHTNAMCKAINVVGYTISIYSVWLIVAVTVERYVAICYPLKSLSLCNRRRACHVILSLLITIFCINIHLVWTAQISTFEIDGQEYLSCDGGENYSFLVDVVWPWVDAGLYSFLPSVVILVLNILIIRNVVLARQSRTGMQGKQSPESGRTHDSSYRLTFMLLTISFAFLISTFPMNIALISTHFYSSNNKGLATVVKFKLFRAITELLMYLNHSMNFYLYCATGQKFRQQLLQMFCRCCKQNTGLDHSYAYNGTVTVRAPATEGSMLNTRASRHQPTAYMTEIKNGEYERVNGDSV